MCVVCLCCVCGVRVRARIVIYVCHPMCLFSRTSCQHYHFSYLLLCMFGMLVYGTVMVEIPIYLPAKEKMSINYI